MLAVLKNRYLYLQNSVDVLITELTSCTQHQTEKQGKRFPQFSKESSIFQSILTLIGICIRSKVISNSLPIMCTNCLMKCQYILCTQLHCYHIKHTNLIQLNTHLESRFRCIRLWFIITISRSLHRYSQRKKKFWLTFIL